MYTVTKLKRRRWIGKLYERLDETRFKMLLDDLVDHGIIEPWERDKLRLRLASLVQATQRKIDGKGEIDDPEQ